MGNNFEKAEKKDGNDNNNNPKTKPESSTTTISAQTMNLSLKSFTSPNVIPFYQKITHHIFTLILFVSLWQFVLFQVTGRWSYPFLPPIWDSFPYGIGYLLFCFFSAYLSMNIVKVVILMNAARFRGKEKIN